MPRYARIFSLIFFTKLSLPLFAALPELSSIEPLEFDEVAQRLVARGDARLDFQNTRLSADRITYYQEYSLADAIGNVAISRDGNRMIAERLSYDTTKIFLRSIFCVRANGPSTFLASPLAEPSSRPPYKALPFTMANRVDGPQT